VTRSVLVEALVVGVVASLIGFGSASGVAIGLRALLGAVGVELPRGRPRAGTAHLRRRHGRSASW
jgi:putative ABC transport system permease protein